LMGIHFFNSLMYCLLYIIYCLTSLAGDDLIWNAMIGPICLTNVIHEAINCVVTILIRKIILKTKHPNLSYRDFNVISKLKDKIKSKNATEIWRIEASHQGETKACPEIGLSAQIKTAESNVMNIISSDIAEDLEELGDAEIPLPIATFPVSRRNSFLQAYTNSTKLLPKVENSDSESDEDYSHTREKSIAIPDRIPEQEHESRQSRDLAHTTSDTDISVSQKRNHTLSKSSSLSIKYITQPSSLFSENNNPNGEMHNPNHSSTKRWPSSEQDSGRRSSRTPSTRLSTAEKDEQGGNLCLTELQESNDGSAILNTGNESASICPPNRIERQSKIPATR
jgi:hypothetical protein